jgi:hypothetical protein
LSGECFAQAIPFDPMGRELQPDELVNLIGRLEIEVLQDVMQEHARPEAALKTGEIIHAFLRLNHRFDWLNGIAIGFFFGASDGQPGETSDHLGCGNRAPRKIAQRVLRRFASAMAESQTPGPLPGRQWPR